MPQTPVSSLPILLGKGLYKPRETKTMQEEDIKKLFAVWNDVDKVEKPSNTRLVLDIVEQVASLFSAGNFYYYVFNIKTYKMDFVSDGTKDLLGISKEKFTLDNLFTMIHPDDLADMHRRERASVVFKMQKIPREDITKYKTVYLLRLKTPDGIYKTILHQAKIINVAKDGKVQQVMGVHTDVTHLDLPIDKKVSFIGYKKPSYFYNDAEDTFDLIASSTSDYTKRELQILNEMVKGYSVEVIGQHLNISVHTVGTHKKNILKKSNCKNTSHLIAKCIREGII